eukprot:s4394_g2.t1
MKGWVRHRAAKIALATVVAMQKSDVGEEVPDLSSAPAVADFFEEARQAKDTMLPEPKCIRERHAASQGVCLSLILD